MRSTYYIYPSRNHIHRELPRKERLFWSSSNFQVTCPPPQNDKVTFVPHPYNCNKFFMCHGSIPIQMSCPESLQFDPSLNVCNWPSVVGCENSKWVKIGNKV